MTQNSRTWMNMEGLLSNMSAHITRRFPHYFWNVSKHNDNYHLIRLALEDPPYSGTGVCVYHVPAISYRQFMARANAKVTGYYWLLTVRIRLSLQRSRRWASGFSRSVCVCVQSICKWHGPCILNNIFQSTRLPSAIVPDTQALHGYKTKCGEKC